MKLVTLPRFVTPVKNVLVEAVKRQSSGMHLNRQRISSQHIKVPYFLTVMSAFPRTSAHSLGQNIKQAPPAPHLPYHLRVQGNPVSIATLLIALREKVCLITNRRT